MQKHDEIIIRVPILQRALTGARIRAHRLDLGLRQAALAQTVSISASYLNLIEHNRRRIGGKLLADIARALGLDPAVLAEGTEAALIDNLRAAAAGQPVELPKTEDFAGRYPGWAAHLIAQAAQIERLQARVAELSDRLSHDPALATSLHSVISAVTAIRSAASILVNDTGLDRDWQDRFHRNINTEARRLADTARALVDYLERPEQATEPRSAPEEFGRWLGERGHHLPQVEAGEDTGGNIVLPPGPAGLLAQHWISRYRADAAALPLAVFAPAAQAVDYAPAPLAARFGVGLSAILRRLASLPPADHPAMGLAICDAAGGVIHLKHIDGFSLPRATAACPLWPLYQALGQPGRAVRADVALPGDLGARFRCFAVADLLSPGFDAPPRTEAVMLVQPGGPGTAPVGPTCRICPRADCPARREPSILG